MIGMRDIFGAGWTAEFQQRVAEGLITERYHPDYPQLAILNYTPQAAYAKAWDKYTLAARGLIYDRSNGRVVARPFAKFFNYGQSEVESMIGVKLTLDTEVVVTNKYDGSLGIVYMNPDGRLAVATRGSFASGQALHATARLLDGDRDSVNDYIFYADEIEDGYTPLVEIIYPENRIVLDYGQKDYLQYLGSVRNSTGLFLPYDAFGTLTVGDVLARKPRPNAEGFVAWVDGYTAVKFKQEDYVRLHAIVTNLSEKAVWEVSRTEDQKAWLEFVTSLPDELQDWAAVTANSMLDRVQRRERLLHQMYESVIDHAWEDEPRCADIGCIPRKALAEAVMRYVSPENRGYMFSIADGKNIMPKLWDSVKPYGLGARPTGSVAAEEG